ncbi:hemolysin D [Psychromonas marina]|uniref:Hemolysin D n=1 Tax=Psychromonas marina TaxID=88364 RepID=A0ABQ6E0K5_9GAMM|nr:HlyD family secretion protein [Psychromonas marina]GLS90789.1 hemolysin D [Psychromonas marina]
MSKRYIATFILVLSAAVILFTLYQNYNSEPWTRDAQVRASIVQITPRVTGQVIAVHIDDNVRVQKGDPLFEIDDSVYLANLHKATASIQQAQAALDKAKNELQRSVRLEKLTPGAVPVLTLNNLANAVETASANLEVAKATEEEAQLNLSFTKIVAPTDGYITNFNLRVGAQVVANSPVVALIDENSFWIEGFFKENDLRGVTSNDVAQVALLTHENVLLEGYVQSISFGIAKTDGSTGNNLLPNVTANFQWIRLAQRIPVKIKLTHVPDNIQLRVGMTASVKIITGK